MDNPRSVTRRKLDGAKHRSRLTRFVRLRRNFVNHDDGLASAVRDHDAGGLFFYVFAETFNDAQRKDDPEVSFRSKYRLLKWLDLPISGISRTRLDHVLDLGERIGFDIREWYIGNDAQGKPRHRHRTFPRIWRVRHHLGGRVKIIFDPEFWKANKAKRPFVKFRPAVIRQLRRPHLILLELFLQAFNYKFFGSPVVLARKMALRERRRHRLRKTIKAATTRVSQVIGIPLVYREMNDGNIRIAPDEPPDGDDDALSKLRDTMPTDTYESFLRGLSAKKQRERGEWVAADMEPPE